MCVCVCVSLASGRSSLGRGVMGDTGHTSGEPLWVLGVSGMSSMYPCVGVRSMYLHSSLNSLRVGFGGKGGYSLSSALDSERKVVILSVSSELRIRGLDPRPSLVISPCART